MVPEHFRSKFPPAFGGDFCSEDRADEWQDFIQSQAEKMPGYE
jgi:hypothetical protein